MKVVIDTNVILDTLARREPFFEQSQAAMQMVAEGAVIGAVTANSISDIYYILRKHLDGDSIRAALRGLMELLEVLNVGEAECLAALDLPMGDYEDALVACCAQTWKADFVITRNIKDFIASPVRAVLPETFIEVVARG